MGLSVTITEGWYKSPFRRLQSRLDPHAGHAALHHGVRDELEAGLSRPITHRIATEYEKRIPDFCVPPRILRFCARSVEDHGVIYLMARCQSRLISFVRNMLPL
jgi:hypothetical protein